MAIHLVRHGETDANAARVVQVPEAPLSARGVEQAELLAARLAGAGITRVLSSDLRRAAETAERVAARAGLRVEIDAGLRERDFGDVRGTPYAELGFDLFAADYAPPGGERWEEFYARVDAVWERVVRAAARTPGHLVVVTHGLVCRAIASRHLTVAQGGRIALAPANASLTVAEPAPPHAVRLLGCTAHLESPAGPLPEPAV